MTENLYTQYANKYYNPNDDGKKPGDNENWESIQKGFSRIGTTQLETTEGITLGKGTNAETEIDPDTALKIKKMIVHDQFKMLVVSSATDLDYEEGGVFTSPYNLDIINFLRTLDPDMNFSFVMSAFDNVKIPFALEITYVDPVTEDETTTYNVLTVNMGRDITQAKIHFKPAYDGVTTLSGYIVGILAVGTDTL